MCGNVKIESIVIEHVVDTDPDTSFLGNYTSILETGVIVRQYDTFYEDLSREEIDKIPTMSREHTGFNPYAGGEKVGTKEYRDYGLKDYEHMEKINKGAVWFVGIIAKAVINVAGTLQHISSGGLYGIESDSDDVYINEIELEQLSELKEQLKALNIDVTNFDDIEIERKN